MSTLALKLDETFFTKFRSLPAKIDICLKLLGCYLTEIRKMSCEKLICYAIS